jgi:hypothetical protein
MQCFHQLIIRSTSVDHVISSLRTSLILTRSLHVTCSEFNQFYKIHRSFIFFFSFFFLLVIYLIISQHLAMIVLSFFFWTDQDLWTKKSSIISRRSVFKFEIFYERITDSMIWYLLTSKTLFRILSRVETHRSHSNSEELARRNLRIQSLDRKFERLIVTSSRKLSLALKKSSSYFSIFRKIIRENLLKISSVSRLNHSLFQSWFYQSHSLH